jgi:hypothetical protein
LRKSNRRKAQYQNKRGQKAFHTGSILALKTGFCKSDFVLWTLEKKLVTISAEIASPKLQFIFQNLRRKL